MTESSPSRVELRDITKRFGSGVVANDSISMHAAAGEIVAIIGENGAGKTTLMKILAGYHRPDSGSIVFEGRSCSFARPRDAMRAGVSMVQQHFSLIPSLTVAENLALGRLDNGFRMSARRMERKIGAEASELGFDIRPGVLVADLSLGERQRVEIFRLICEARGVLILDEPTSLLAPRESAALLDHLRRLAEAGRTIFLVTHKIRQALSISDRIYVMRRGRVVAEFPAAGVTERQVAEQMTGATGNHHATQAPVACPSTGEAVLRVENLHTPPRKSAFGVRGVSFEVRAGEIVGISGISGNGQEDLVTAVAGLDSFRGLVSIHGAPTSRAGAMLAHVPNDARRDGSVGSMSLAENLALTIFRRPHGIWLDYDQMRKDAGRQIARFHVVTSGVDAPAATLSGGNLQKLILARELSGDPNFVLAVNPTAGLDVATVGFVRNLLVECAGRGAAVLLVSEDMDELLAIGRRILVMHAGAIVGERTAVPESLGDIGLLMSGLDPERATGRTQTI